MKLNKTNLIVWTAILAIIIAGCVIYFQTFKGLISEINKKEIDGRTIINFQQNNGNVVKFLENEESK